MMKFWPYLKLCWIAFCKYGGDIIDVFKPKGIVTLTLRYAHGPKKGQVAKVVKGRNIITGFIAGGSPRSGRDVMRRLIVPVAFTGSLSGDDDSTFSLMRLGSGTTAETSGDLSLVAPIAGSAKAFTSVEFNGSNPYVTFITEYDETEVNQSLSEMSVETVNTDFVARKTFTPFVKTSDFTLEVRYQVRF